MSLELETVSAELERIAETFGGVLGYTLTYPDTGEIALQYLGNEMFPTASVIKIAVMCAVMEKVDRNELDWAESVSVTPSHSGQREEGGPAFHFRNRTRLPLCEWLHLMICLSDNTATIVLRNLVGQGAINDWLFRHGFKVTRLLNGAETDILGLREMQQEYGLGVTTPNEMAHL
ncbi:MAG: class A beta-lactamase-related serine hydrolase, partial [Armatimonadetes bacterium]|nr:class A beta-lactamase-related serine hydrolase [Armatimonadota bacterium]